MSNGRKEWPIVVLGLVVLAIVPFLVTRFGALTPVLAILLAIFWVLLWRAIYEPRRRTANVIIVLGVICGLVLGVLGAGLYCVTSACRKDTLELIGLVPLGALLGAAVGGVIGSVVGARVQRGVQEPHPAHRPDGS